MIRKIIQIDENKCTGCGLCESACHEGAIEIVNGKAKLVRENFCDGFGDCLPNCPSGAISFIEREAPAYDEEAVKKAKEEKSRINSFLLNWPVQIKLAPLRSEGFDDVDLLIAADCTAYSYMNFHKDFMKDRATLIACPKLDNTDYSIKLTEIFKANRIKSVTITRMEVPCCMGLVMAVKKAIENSGKDIPLNTTVISIEGDIIG